MEVESVKTIMRLRWILVAMLFTVLYFAYRKQWSLIGQSDIWFFVALMLFVGLSGQLDRIERKVDAMAKRDPPADSSAQTG